MVREVHLSWDSDQPYPAELERNNWDSDEPIIDELQKRSRKQDLRKRKFRIERNSNYKPPKIS